MKASIIAPANGTRIKPGVSFPFKYQSISDYGVTSYNYTVWLLTQPPTPFQSTQVWAGGYSFGQFAEPNYPGNPHPGNRPPTQLVMPDFSKPLGGWGTGASVSNATFYLAVFEEYGDGTVSSRSSSHFHPADQYDFQPFVGRRIHLSINEIIYNSTLKSDPLNVQSLE
ncbi:hypothetical protein V5O48_001372 [Marasmius crinis-equi]|uniref:Neprosin domain-containing protein n=1 Tax=Marasmius crinis-equi TaxID=585013 RepID=A0ABR3FYW0_9AGAR